MSDTVSKTTEELPSDNTATWWTPSGYTRRPAPAVHQRMLNDADETDWQKLLRDHGYEEKTSIEDSETVTMIQMVVYENNNSEEPHLFLEIWDVNSVLATLFISSEHADVFFFEKFPQLMLSIGQSAIARYAETQSKTLLAFVRHGVGTDTISEYGDRTADDRRRSERQKDLRKQSKTQPTVHQDSKDQTH